mmetsp:Transcript_33371/g.92126  ORF Transcript_33371/g.92126 Transcript_33371/m.92126 type:complete len:236 (+) Transcript_33371:1377-2084(+)
MALLGGGAVHMGGPQRMYSSTLRHQRRGCPAAYAYVCIRYRDDVAKHFGLCLWTLGSRSCDERFANYLRLGRRAQRGTREVAALRRSRLRFRVQHPQRSCDWLCRAGSKTESPARSSRSDEGDARGVHRRGRQGPGQRGGHRQERRLAKHPGRRGCARYGQSGHRCWLSGPKGGFQLVPHLRGRKGQLESARGKAGTPGGGALEGKPSTARRIGGSALVANGNHMRALRRLRRRR